MGKKNVRAYVIGYDGACETHLEEGPDGTFLESMQDVVDDCIAQFGVLFDNAVELYIGDESLYRQPANRAVTATAGMAAAGYLSQADMDRIVREGELYTVLHGPILAVAYDEDGEMRSLTDSEVEEIDAYFSLGKHGPGSGYAAEMGILSRARAREHARNVEEAEQLLAFSRIASN